MPLQNRLANDYDPDQLGLAPGIRSLGQAMTQMPAIRARGAELRAQTARQAALANEATARGGEADARTSLLKAQGLKTQQEFDAAQEIADALKQPGAISRDTQGNVTIAAPAFQGMISALAKTAKGANDFGGGMNKLFTTENAPIQEQANRENKVHVAQVKPVILKPGESAYGNQPPTEPGTDPETGDPVSGVASRLIASVPGSPVKPLPDYTSTTIRQERNPAYNIAQGATNVPPVINMTNTTSRVGRQLAQQPSNNASQPQAAPAPEARQRGQVYQTPKGALKWTGTGWTQP